MRIEFWGNYVVLIREKGGKRWETGIGHKPPRELDKVISGIRDWGIKYNGKWEQGEEGVRYSLLIC